MDDRDEIMSAETGNRREFLKGMLLGGLTTGVVFLAALLFSFGTIGNGKPQGAQVLTSRATRNKLRAVQALITEDALQSPDAATLESYMFKGIAVGLDDPYAVYYSAEEYQEVRKDNRGAYKGIGVVFTQFGPEEETAPAGKEPETGGTNGTGEPSAAGQTEGFRVEVTTVYEGSPAQEAGILEGDVLLGVEDVDLEGRGLEEVMEELRRAFQEKEEVSLVMLRGEERVTIPVREAQVALTHVSGELAEDGIGYIRIPEFTEVTPEQFRETLLDLEEEAGEGGLNGLVLDVRGNPGGIVESVGEVLDDLLDECVLLTSYSAKGVGERLLAKDGKLFDGEMAVLTDGNSASAAEVFAGVLQYRGAAAVVGETTYGKGTIQHTYTLRDGSAFKLTSEKYAICGEKEIDGVGVVPDLPVEEGQKKERAQGQEKEKAEEQPEGRAEDRTAEQAGEQPEEQPEKQTEEQPEKQTEEQPAEKERAGETGQAAEKEAGDPVLLSALDLLRGSLQS